MMPSGIMPMIEYSNYNYAGKAFDQLTHGEIEAYEEERMPFLEGKLYYECGYALYSGYYSVALLIVLLKYTISRQKNWTRNNALLRS